MQEKVKGQRNGYDQRKLPGSFHHPSGELGIIHQNMFLLSVVEPINGRWDVGLGPIANHICKSVDKIEGGRGYDSKYMCSFDDLKRDVNISTRGESARGECDVISIGSNGQWGFELHMTKAAGCIMHTFDCTVKDSLKPNNDNIHFYPYCIASVNDERKQYRTYSKLIHTANMTKPPVLFKIDVEGFEYEVMTQMLQEARDSGTTALLPAQVSIELHYATRMLNIPWKLRSLTAAEITLFMGMMYNRGGYLPVLAEKIGRGCHSCVEVLFARVFCD
eukprot:TRINITY_DN29843_c0_g1_i1.p1 TRINITY_DN29843_c0_g1~~TRINITY_DN29843_c0_g1_i1.p1  ORF type:complete len:276 (+),score=12.54 TRINITY_DN29843_c0_g1_i1:470-1297(+)